MKTLFWAKSIVALCFLSLMSLLLVGCSGSGGSSVPVELQGLTPAAVEGTITPANNRAAGGNTQEHFFLRFGQVNGQITGSANFDRTLNGQVVAVYSAQISNVQRVNSNQQGTAGTLSFQLTNFTAGAPYQSMTWSGNFTWNGQTGTGSVFTIANGSITAVDSSGQQVTGLGFSFSILANAPDTNFAGNWNGSMTFEGLGTVPWTGVFTRTSEVTTNASITSGAVQIPIQGRTTFNTFAGSFDPSVINPLLQGSTAVFFVTSQQGSSTMSGHVMLVDPKGSIVTIGTVTGTRGAPAVTLTAGYYQGTIKPQGGQNRSLSVHIVTASSTAGANGSAVIIMPEGTPNAGFRVSQVTTSGTTTSVVLTNPTSGYTAMTLQGTPTAQGGFSGTYTATLAAGGTENGTFTSSKLSNVPNYNIAGTWSGQITGQSGTPNNWAGTIFQTGNEFTLNISTTVTFGGVPFTIPYAIHGYVIGNSFVGHVDQDITITQPAPLSGNILGDFDGTISNNGGSLNGAFMYVATANGFGSFPDQGTFTGTRE